MGTGVDSDHFGIDPDIETEAFEQPFGSLEEEVFLLFDHAADEVGKAAVGVRDMARPFDDRDLCRLV